jgi:hypothetical protein
VAEDLNAAPVEAFHYTDRRNLKRIMAEGLRKESYATLIGTLSPLQAFLDLALDPERNPPDAVIRIDLVEMTLAGFELPPVVSVARKFNLPGGGFEMMFPYEIEPQFLSVVKP